MRLRAVGELPVDQRTRVGAVRGDERYASGSPRSDESVNDAALLVDETRLRPRMR